MGFHCRFAAKSLETLTSAVRNLGNFLRFISVSSQPPVVTKPEFLSWPYPKKELEYWSNKPISAIHFSLNQSDFKIVVDAYPQSLHVERSSTRPKSLYARESIPNVTHEFLKSLLICEDLDSLMTGALTFEIPNITVKKPLRPKRPSIEGGLVDLSETEKKLNALLSIAPSISPAESELTDRRGRWYREKYTKIYDLFAGEVWAHQNLIDGYARLLDAQKNYNERGEKARRETDESFNRISDTYKATLSQQEELEKNEKLKAQSFVEEIKNSASRLRSNYEIGTREDVERYFNMFLRRLPLPNFVPKDWELSYDEIAKIIIVDYKFLSLAEVSFCKIVQLKSGQAIKPPNKGELKALASAFYPTISLRLAREVVNHDFADKVHGVCINGWVNHKDGATGLERKTYISSMFVKKEDLLSINLPDVDPARCFDSFSGRVIRAESLEIAPVNPIIRFDKSDKRFVEGRDVLDSMSAGMNLAAVDWEEFEHLVRELFEKLFTKPGVEVRVTQASRDKGVDAVVFDPTPITGGKLVIQAKRYVNVVDVSSVRDLYGTLLNEGASKGILVTTSSYGMDSYEFAKNKPIDLISGAELLGLLSAHGYKARIDLEEARQLMANQNVRR